VSAFHEVSMALPFSLGASGGPERRVDIVTLGSGAETRNTPWAHGRRRYDVGGAVRTLDEMHELIAFLRRGAGSCMDFAFAIRSTLNPAHLRRFRQRRIR